jgi:hypothetical protein
MAEIPLTDPWYQAETIPPALAKLRAELAAAFGVPLANIGIRGGRTTHFRGAHRSRDFIRNSPHCTDRTYTVSRTPGDRAGGDSRWCVGLDLKLTTAELIKACQRLDAAVRAGRLEKITEWYGTFDGERVVGFDNIVNRAASSDPSHLWHLHMTFDRGRAGEDHADVLAVLTGGDIVTPEDIEAIARRSAELVLARGFNVDGYKFLTLEKLGVETYERLGGGGARNMLRDAAEAIAALPARLDGLAAAIAASPSTDLPTLTRALVAALVQLAAERAAQPSA